MNTIKSVFEHSPMKLVVERNQHHPEEVYLRVEKGTIPEGDVMVSYPEVLAALDATANTEVAKLQERHDRWHKAAAELDEDLAEVISGHRRIGYRGIGVACACGWSIFASNGWNAAHAAHLAAVVLAHLETEGFFWPGSPDITVLHEGSGS